jgi:lipoprotein-anchoring transpeptidase ErfK/SrfK
MVKEESGIRVRPRYLLLLFACGTLGLPPATPATAYSAPTCHAGQASEALVGQPTNTVSWRAELLTQTGFYATIPRMDTRRRGSVAPSQAAWLLVLDATDRRGHCWVKVRLPTRPNGGTGWIDSASLRLRPTSWRIVISLARRTLTVDHAGTPVRRLRVVVGAHVTPTPTGLFSIIGAWRSAPNAFLGSWILPLTAHSNVLHEFDGGDGLVGIHGRGGASLRDPLGSARSHGCIRLANTAIDWLVHTISLAQLPGIPVWVR